jgi:hypothetical protein
LQVSHSSTEENQEPQTHEGYPAPAFLCKK